MQTATAPVSGDTARPAGGPDAPRRVPFTVIDQAVHLLETAAEPWGIQFELTLSGRLDEARLGQAVQTALARHPMARARQVPARRTDPTWVWAIPEQPDVDPLRVVECPDGAALAAVRDDFYSRPVPLVESPPFRLLLARRPEADSLLLNVNHAAFDGFGCVRFLQSVARAYTGREDSEPSVSLEEARDVERLLASPDRDTRGRRLRILASKVADLATRPARLASDGGEALPGYGIHHVSLSQEQTADLSREDGPTVNDLLLTALHLAAEAWNREHGAESGRISVLVPVNLRPKEWREDVVTNMVLDSRVLTTPEQRADLKTALKVVHEQDDQLKKGGGAALIEAIGAWSSLPLWTKQPLSSFLTLTGNRLVDTALLSNLGPVSDPPDFGSDVGPVKEAWFSAPTRMPCGLAVGASTLDKRLHLAFRYRHPLFDRSAAERFARVFLSELERVATC